MVKVCKEGRHIGFLSHIRLHAFYANAVFFF